VTPAAANATDAVMNVKKSAASAEHSDAIYVQSLEPPTACRQKRSFGTRPLIIRAASRLQKQSEREADHGRTSRDFLCDGSLFFLRHNFLMGESS
jgi:hypothetical protein